MFERGEGGAVELRLSGDERSLLAGLVLELRALLDGAPGDPSLRRLFPPAYDEADDEQAYRDKVRELRQGLDRTGMPVR